MSHSRVVWTLMINLNSSKDGFKPCTEKPTTTSLEDFFSLLPSNTAKTHIRSPPVLLLSHLKHREISSVFLLTVPWGLQAQPGCWTLQSRYVPCPCLPGSILGPADSLNWGSRVCRGMPPFPEGSTDICLLHCLPGKPLEDQAGFDSPAN